MPTFQIDNYADAIALTQKELGKNKFTINATDLQNYVALPNLLKKNRTKFDSGTSVQFNTMVSHSGAASNVGLFETMEYGISDNFVQGEVPWRFTHTYYAIEERVIAMNRTPAKIVDLVQAGRIDANVSLAEQIEQDFWDKPPDSSDKKKPFGIGYWCVDNASEGFNGGNPSGFSSGAAGISSSTYTRWANWTDTYASMEKTTMVREWRKASYKTNFKPPTPVPEYDTGRNFGYYTTYTVVAALEELLEDQNDKLGMDIAPMDGQASFRRVPVTPVPYLDANHDTGNIPKNPIYGINWGVFKIFFLRGEFMRESAPKTMQYQHRTQVVDIDMSWNTICRDRRKLFVLYDTSS